MKLNSALISNAAFTLACLTFVALGAMKLSQSLGSTAMSQPPNPVTTVDSTISIANVNTVGATTASAVMIEFSDFHCPYCAQYFDETYHELKSEFVDTGRLRYVSMQLPLPMHPNAEAAGAAAECAGLQGKYWLMRDELFKDARTQSLSFLEHAQRLTLNQDDFANCLKASGPEKVRAQMETAKALGIRTTPTFLLGTVDAKGNVHATKRLSGAYPAAVFREVIRDVVNSSL
jgi:protein-disulfide isomerase